ncbi:MAG: MoaD/ThiS family protein [Proteobacteria bacterium]|nr:MoaD/ThiS family protein [Pseudomonadota bacterium]
MASHRVRIASPLRSYTAGAAAVSAEGGNAAALLADLDRRYPGIRFRMIDEQDRIRPHIRLYADREELRSLTDAVPEGAVLHLICALSGG